MKWHERIAGLLMLLIISLGALWQEHQGHWLGAIMTLLFGIFLQLTRIIETLRSGFISEPIEEKKP